MKRLFLAAVAAIALSSPVLAAPACAPLDLVVKQVKAAGIPDENVIVSDDTGFISDYHKAVGITIPDGSEPAKLLLVVLPTHAVIGIVERVGDCIRFHAKIPLDRHLAAVAEAAAGV